MKIYILAIIFIIANTSQLMSQTNSIKKPYIINTIKDDIHSGKVKATIMWQIDDAIYNNYPNCKLEYGLNVSSLNQISNILQTTTDHLYKVELDNLDPGSLYNYKITLSNNSQTYQFQTITTFRTAPADNAQNAKFFAYGDTRANEDGIPINNHNEVCGQMLNEINSDPLSQTLLLHAGDWVNHDKEICWSGEYFYENDANAIELRSKVALMGVIGNHEQDGGEYLKYFPYPYENISTSGNKWSYSMDYGPIHFLMLDIQSSKIGDPGYKSELSQAELDWIDNDLSSTNKKWKVIMFHIPVHTLHKNLAPPAIITAIKQKAKAHGVQLVLVGHEHYYSHWIEEGTHFMILGGGGCWVNNVRDDLIQSSDEVYAATVPHFGKFDVQGDIMKVDIIQGKAAKGYSSGRKIEEFSIPVSYNIESSITFNNPIDHPIMIDQLTIKQGGTLTINSTVTIAKSGNIIVNKGGKLIIDGANANISNTKRATENLGFLDPGDDLEDNEDDITYTANYTEDQKLWQGILVQGDAGALQTPETNQGVLEMKNGATIENAEVAVYVGKFFVSNSQSSIASNSGGGIIKINGANFVNNQKDILMRPYSVWTSLYGKPKPQTSYIKHSVFNNNANMLTDDIMQKGKIGNIYTQSIKGLRVQGNVFENLNTTLAVSDRGTGINSINSSLNISPYCDPNISPCSIIEKNKFKNLYYGVVATGGGGMSQITIDNNLFDNTTRSILLTGTHNAEITLNDIKLPGIIPNGSSTPYGIYIMGGSGYTIEDNYLYKTGSTMMFNGTRGIIVENTGENNNKISNNDFSNLFLGIQSQYENSGFDEEYNEVGLVLLCNTSQTSFYDFVALGKAEAANQTPNPNYARIGFAYYQKLVVWNNQTQQNDDYPAGNDFSTVSGRTGDYQFDNDDANSVIYSYDASTNASANAEPTLISSNVYPDDIALTNPCQSNTGGNGTAITTLYTNLANAKLSLNTSKLILSIWKDGGNANLDEEVESTLPWEAYQQFNDLLAESPYLSEEVLLETVNNPVFTSLMVKLIMVANPHCTRSEEIMMTLEERIPAMPQSYIDEIRLGESNISQLEILKGNVASDNHLVSMIGEDIKRNYKKDDESTWATDSLIAFMSRQPNLVDKFELASIYFDLGKYTNMESVFTDISNMELDDIHTQDYTNFVSIMNIATIAKQEGLLDDFLSETQVTNMETILNSKRANVSSFALAILKQNNVDYEFNEEVLDVSESSARLAHFHNKEVVSESPSDYRIFPNPSKDYITLEYTTQSEGETIYSIRNGDGKVVLQKLLPNTDTKIKTEVIIDVQGFAAGVYYFNLISNGENLNTQKLVIIK